MLNAKEAILSARTTKYDIYRAILEGLCLDQELNLSVLRGQGINVKHIIAVGGGSRSRA